MMKKSFSCLIIAMCVAISGCGSQIEGQLIKEDADVSQADDETTPDAESTTEKNAEAEESAQEEPSPEETEKIEITSDQLKTILVEEAGTSEDRIQFFSMDDYDNDGENEAFAITGENVDYDMDGVNVVGDTVWFVNDTGAKKLVESSGIGFECKTQILDFDEKKYIIMEEAYGVGGLSYVYEVKGKVVSEASFSKIGGVKEQDDATSFRIVDSSYDAEYDPEIDDTLGHTWKSYYFFYDPKTESVKEYGGIEISKEKATELAERDIVDECLSSDDDLDSIYYRANGIININYSRKREGGSISYFHRTWDMEKRCYIDDFYEESDEEQIGTYRPALCEDLAVYRSN